MTPRPLHHGRGVTLIELVIFLVIIAIAAAAIAPLFSAVLTGAHRPKMMIQAHYLAMGRLDSALALRNRPGGYAALASATDSITLDGTSFTRTLAVDASLTPGVDPCPAGVAGCKLLTATISSGGENYADVSALVVEP